MAGNSSNSQAMWISFLSPDIEPSSLSREPSSKNIASASSSVDFPTSFYPTKTVKLSKVIENSSL